MMNRIIRLTFIFCIFTLSALAQKNTLPVPDPPRLVVDYANILSDSEKEMLERKLVALDDSTSNQICVATVTSLNDRPIEDVATATFRAWGIGNKKTNNGVLLLVSVNDHQIRIEVGYGLEGAIPDIICGNIIDNDLKPAFRANSYCKGIDLAVNDLSKAAAGEYKIKNIKKRNTGKGIGFGVVPLLILFIIIIFILSRGNRGSGNGGSSGGDIARGILIGSILSNLGNSGRGGGWSDGGGGWSGGDFGGFGGGSSGGGGASGSW
jgi:uncharacterized protein